jgi:hypothetical protein
MLLSPYGENVTHNTLAKLYNIIDHNITHNEILLSLAAKTFPDYIYAKAK